MSIASDTQGPTKVSVWNDPRVRSAFVQVLVLGVLLLLAYEVVRNTVANLQRLNKSFGFDFLTQTAGFDIIQHLIPYSSTSRYGDALLVGLLNTLVVSVLSIIAATIIGFVVGIMRLSKNWLVARLATIYIEFFRNIPLLLQIFVWYSVVVVQTLPPPKQALNPLGVFYISNRGLMMPEPVFGPGSGLGLAGLVVAIAAIWGLRRWAHQRQGATGKSFPAFRISLAMLIALPVIGFAIAGFPVTFNIPHKTTFSFSGGLTVIPEFLALFLALSVYEATYIAEAVRAGVQAVSHGQTEAAHALGLRSGPTMRLVVVPQALRVIIPPLASTYLSLTKNSSLAVAIGYPDLVAAGGTVLNQTGKAIEIVGIWMVVYLSLSLFTSVLMNWFNARMRLVER
jgi:general L-amino acid transport system permease protein